MPRAMIANRDLKLRLVNVQSSHSVELSRDDASSLLAEAVRRFPEAQRVIELANSEDPRLELPKLLTEFASEQPKTVNPFYQCEVRPVFGNAVSHPMHDEPTLVSNVSELIALAAYVRNPSPWRVLHSLASFFTSFVPPDSIRKAGFKRASPHFVALTETAARDGGPVVVNYPSV